MPARPRSFIGNRGSNAETTLICRCSQASTSATASANAISVRRPSSSSSSARALPDLRSASEYHFGDRFPTLNRATRAAVSPTTSISSRLISRTDVRLIFFTGRGADRATARCFPRIWRRFSPDGTDLPRARLGPPLTRRPSPRRIPERLGPDQRGSRPRYPVLLRASPPGRRDYRLASASQPEGR